jgi:predicted NUDIX family phosphoesterase
MVEQILVVPTELFHSVGYFQGFCPDVEPYLAKLLHPANISFRPRDQMEQDPGFKQLIPYCLFRHGDTLFHYTRGTAQGEKRLHAKRSVGVGGHIADVDLGKGPSLYREAMRREIEEEVHVDTAYRDRCVGLLNDDLTEVGKVHLGILHLFELDAAKVSPREQSMLEAGFAPVAELVRDTDQFETWSQLCLKHLFGGA